MRPLPTVLVSLLAAAPIGAQDLAAFRTAMDARLAGHPFFTRIDFTVVDRHPPFVFYLQRPSRDDAEYERKVVNSYLPFLNELTRQFHAAYTEPLGLQRSPTAAGFAIAILDSAGSYLNFRTAIGEPSLAQARAHYTPDLRLAVTYVDAFAQHDTNAEERHALLHEFVHAMQHAHAARDQMPAPVWYNEGLADYRSSCTSVARSLAEPPTQDRHIRALAFGYCNPAGRYYVAPIADLVAANSYQEVVDLATKRNGAELRTDFLLPMFYAQSEMFVRFLHEVDDGALLPAFGAYMKAVQGGASGVDTFRRAFDCGADAQLAALEARWLGWLDARLRVTYPSIPSLTRPAPGAVADAGPLSPPVPIENTGLAFTADDFDARVAGARSQCADGAYEAALEMLPGDSDELDEGLHQRGRRARQRVVAVIALRDEILADARGRVLRLEVGGEQVRGRLVRADAGELVLEIGRAEQVFPLTVMTPRILVREGNRLKKFEGDDRWLQIWLRWLGGDDLARLARALELDYPSIAALRDDLAQEFDAAAGAGAQALSALQTLRPTDDPVEARRELQRLRAVLQQAGGSPILGKRKAAVEALARAYAERAFDPKDLGSQGVTGAVTRLDDGRVQVDYTDAPAGADFDFVEVQDLATSPLAMPEGQIAYAGPTGFHSSNGLHGLVGSGQLRWPLAMSGPQVVEFEFVIHNLGEWGVMLCMDEGGCLMVSPWGEVLVLDEATRMADVVSGANTAELMPGKAYRVAIEHDGNKQLAVKRDGKVVTQVANVGQRLRGGIGLMVHSSTPLTMSRFRITGEPVATDLQAARDRFVKTVIDTLWP